MSTTAACRVRRRISLSLNLWLILIIASCNCGSSLANKKGYCPSSSCGKIRNISYPFRLDTDPPYCGSREGNFTLFCHNNSSVSLYPYDNIGRFLVKGIDYENFTIHLVDPGLQEHNCSSLPISPISSISDQYALSTTYMKQQQKIISPLYLSKPIVFVRCEKQVTSSSSEVNYVDTTTASCLIHSKKYSYVIVGRYHWGVSVSDLEKSCIVDMITLVPLPEDTRNTTTLSYLEIHKQLSYGFHLSWYRVCCLPNCWKMGFCYLDEANRPACAHENVLDKGLIIEDITFHLITKILIPIGYMFGMGNKLANIANDLIDSMRFTLYNFGQLLDLTLITILLILVAFVMYHLATFILYGPCVFAFLIYKWRRRHLSSYDSIEEFLQNHTDLVPIRYSYKDIKKITKCFKDKLGEGGFGCVYKGKFRSGELAAIKILDKSSKVTNGQDFMNELATIGKIHHVNVVQLVGYCVERSNRALVYDFMPNGSLDKYIFPKQGFVSLSWEKLFDISLGVARGIEYLHQGCDMQILHFDIKPHNILLDENFIPKISDFGLAKLYPTAMNTIASLTAARGTIGYMAPELFYKNIGHVSYKADVYSFGMLLLEIAGKRRNLNASRANSSHYFPSWVHDQVSNGDDMEIVDSATKEETIIVKKMVIVGLWCIQMNLINRPSMNKVVEMLEGDSENLQIPPKHVLCPNEMPNIAETDESSDMLGDSSESISLIASAG